MPKGGHGRGAIAAIGLVLLFAGLVGGVVLWVLADREPEKAAESFARAAPGCTTTLTFGEAGTFYVYEELSGVAEPVEGCQPSTLPGRAFTFTITTADGIEVARVEDTTQSYDLDAGQGTSVARITIPAPGEYRISVVGEDPAVVAAVGGDPEEGVADLRNSAIAAAAAGIVLGGLLLLLSGRRSKRAATFSSPLDPGWGVTERDHQRRAEAAVGADLPAPVVGQVPVNPHAPDERRVAQLGRDATLPAPPAPGAAAAPLAAHQPTLFDAPPNPAPVAPAVQRDQLADVPTGDAALAGDGSPGTADAATTDGEDRTEAAAGTADDAVAGGSTDAAAEEVTGDHGAAPAAGAQRDLTADAECGPVGDGSSGDDESTGATGDGSSGDDESTGATGDGSSGDDESTDAMPVAAPVPEDEVGPSGRDDAGDTSSDDDTPPA